SPAASITSPAPRAVYPLALHDALPICAPVPEPVPARCPRSEQEPAPASAQRPRPGENHHRSSDPHRHQPSTRNRLGRYCACHRRSEEHTSELQSRENLVCRLLLEKKKK